MFRLLKALATLMGSFAVLVSMACDFNSSPTSSTTVNQTPTSGARLTGTITSPPASSQRLVAFAQTDLDEITVEVQNTDIKTQVRSDGSFTLQGLPVGSFTLLFRNEDGLIIGKHTFTNVVDGQAISILLELAHDTVTLVEERRDGVIVVGTITEDDENEDDDTSDDSSDDSSDDESEDHDSDHSS